MGKLCVTRNQGLWENVCDKESRVVWKMCVIRNQGLCGKCV